MVGWVVVILHRILGHLQRLLVGKACSRVDYLGDTWSVADWGRWGFGNLYRAGSVPLYGT